VEENRATDDAGGLYNKGVLTMDHSTIWANEAADIAGGIWQHDTGTGEISNSLVAWNQADYAGGLYNLGQIDVYNSTIYSNGDLQSPGYGGMYNASSSTFGLRNVLLAHNDGYDCFRTEFTTITADVGNLIQSNGVCGTPAVSTDPGSLHLGWYGNVLRTLAPEPGSDAIDAGNDAACSAYPVYNYDERWVRRPQGLHCDIGAHELSRTPTDFDADGKTEPAKYVSSAGAVYYYASSVGDWGSFFVGTDGEYVLNSNFDGDGQTEPAKYVAAAGAVWYFSFYDYAWHGVYVGSDGEYIPASDFDGDGQTDPAKYVAAAGAVWYRGSADSTWHGVYIGSLGGGEYIPGSDFDGDGKTDPAKYVDGGVYWRQSSTGTWASQYIGPDGPYVPRSDYDGDGKTDPAKFVSPNIWYLQSASAYALTTINLGADTTFVVPGSDFDGDGITDPAKFVDTADAIWYTRSSDAESVGVYMGADTYDIVN